MVPQLTRLARYQLADIVEHAGRLSPTNAIGRAEVDEALAVLAEARSASWPSVRVVAGVAPAPRIDVEVDEDGIPRVQDDRTDLELLEDITSLGWRADVNVIIPITTFGRLRLARRAARVGVEAAELGAGVTTDDAVHEAARAFLGLQWYERFDRLLTEAEGRLDEAEARLEEQIEDGDRAARTSLRELAIVRAGFADLRTQADAAGGLARFALERALQLPPGFEVERFSTDPGVEAPPALDTVLGAARALRPDYRRLDAAVEAATLQRRIRRREWAPEIGLNLSLATTYTPTVTDLRGPFVYDPFNRFGIGVSVGLNWNLHVARNLARSDRADAVLETALAEREGAWVAIEIEVAEAYFEAVARYRALAAWAEGARAAEARLDQVAFQYDQGLADFDEIEDPLKDYYQTQGAWLKAVLDFRLALADLAATCGTRAYDRWPAE